MENEGAFKNWINPVVVKKIAAVFSSVNSDFDPARFEGCSRKLKELELKGRVLLITSALRTELPGSFKTNAKVLKKVLARKMLSGFELWPVSEFISQFGLQDIDESMELMYLLTQQFTAEFAVRPFLQQNPKTILAKFEKWATDKNSHVRRWVSEGSRPLLPWGGKIHSFIERPATLHLLEILKYDDELYVRKSVANHLNDISKDHPELVIVTLKKWLNVAPAEHEEKIQWIKKHALRTLIKKGHVGALGLMGVTGNADVKISKFKLNKNEFKVGDTLEFEFQVESVSRKTQKVIVDYGIGFLKSSGSISTKMFKLKSIDLPPAQRIALSKRHSLKKITTSTFYSGTHELILQVNGKILKKLSWEFNV
jgi:3-methyladenine DNA glycosylase AlkC